MTGSSNICWQLRLLLISLKYLVTSSAVFVYGRDNECCLVANELQNIRLQETTVSRLNFINHFVKNL